jgi:serine/threonine protein kinase/Tol biopolymer transport system component
MVGQTLLHYKIVEKIGEGGMGAVYRALDTHLDRHVAIKVLPPDKVSDPERKQRFIQEAKAASALRHPNIVVIHDIATDRGLDFIVMELVEGQSLDRLIKRKGLKLSPALGYAVQIADGLAKAHAAGIIHRDLKPTNIMVTEDGLIKILDFGLAKLMEEEFEPGAGRTMTLGRGERPRTEEGFILGTAAYMSPEQAEGKTVDARSDIFSFGTVLYEMLTGQKAFAGESRIKTLAAVLSEEPKPASSANEEIPPEAERLLNRCLRKDLQRRWQTMSDLKVALLDLKEDSESGKLQAAIAPRRGNKRTVILMALAALVVVAAAVLFMLVFLNPKAPVEFEIIPLTFNSGLTGTPTVSADGKLMAYASDREGSGTLDIWVQQVSGGEPLRRTDHPADDWFPSLSPDGSKIVFRSERNGGGLYIIDALGGEERRMVDKGYWPKFSPDGSLISYITIPASGESEQVKMFLISSKGGHPSPFHPEFCCDYFSQGATPVWSPDGKYLLFHGRRVADPASIDWWMASVEGGEPVRTHAVENLALTSPVQWPTAWSGNHVYFVSGMTLEGINIFRVPIDPGNWTIRGPAEPLTTGPGMKFWASATSDGHILFTNMTIVLDAWSVAARPDEAIVLSNPEKLTTDRMQKFHPSISRDGTEVAFAAFGGVQAARYELRLKNLTTGQETTVPTQAMSTSFLPRLSSDGSVLAYRDFVSDKWRTFVIPVGGASSWEVCDSCVILDFFPDTNYALVQVDPDKLEKMNLRNGERSPVLAVEKGSISDASLSPDGAWISYLTGEPDGQAVIWISPISGSSAAEKQRILITEDDRCLSPPKWSPNGYYIYFVSGKNDRGSIYAQELDPATKELVGEAREVYFSPDSRFHLNFPLGHREIGVAADKIIFRVSEMTGNIFLAKPKSR